MLRFKNFGFTPVLGWSFSRYDRFSECKRSYYYNYYGKYDQEHSRETIDKLKDLTSLPMEIGKITHDIISELLERLKITTDPIDKEKFEKRIRTVIDEKLRVKRFFEIYYHDENEITLDRIYPKVASSLYNLLDSDRFEWLKEKAIQTKDQWLIEPSRYGESRLGDLKLYCKVDFLIPVDNRVVILEWKTGKKDEKHHRQLIGYAATAAYHLDKAAEDMEPVLVYLHPEYTEDSIQPNQDDLQTYQETILRQTQEMYEFCSDHQENIPKDKEVFLMRENDYKCRYCNFKELCNR